MTDTTEELSPLEAAYQAYLKKSGSSDTKTTHTVFEAGWNAHVAEPGSSAPEVPPDLNR